MPFDDAIGEIILRPLLEVVFYGIFYLTGFVFLKGVTLGCLPLAPLGTLYEKNRDRRKWYQIDWSVWLYRPMHGRALKAEWTCLVGFLIWVGIGLALYRLNLFTGWNQGLFT